MLSALLGYAIGTLQILLIDWWRERTIHARHLRSIRAELRQARTLTRIFDWDEHGPKDDYLPRAPSVSNRFTELVTQTHFYLTDEHDDDNTQEALLAIEDGCRALQAYIQQVEALISKLRDTHDVPGRASLKETITDLAKHYDQEQPKLVLMITEALKDIDRRLGEARAWRQLNRPLGRLPEGQNPPPITDGDPRLKRSAG